MLVQKTKRNSEIISYYIVITFTIKLKTAGSELGGPSLGDLAALEWQ